MQVIDCICNIIIAQKGMFKMEKYVLNLYFADKPNCEICMLSFGKIGHNGETQQHCAALGQRPICPNEGCRKDCPLQLTQ